MLDPSLLDRGPLVVDRHDDLLCHARGRGLASPSDAYFTSPWLWVARRVNGHERRHRTQSASAASHGVLHPQIPLFSSEGTTDRDDDRRSPCRQTGDDDSPRLNLYRGTGQGSHSISHHLKVDARRSLERHVNDDDHVQLLAAPHLPGRCQVNGIRGYLSALHHLSIAQEQKRVYVHPTGHPRQAVQLDHFAPIAAPDSPRQLLQV